MPVKSKKSSKLEAEVKRMHTQTVVFKSNSEEEDVAWLARTGWTTKAIAATIGVSEAQAQYRILKAQRQVGVRFRSEFRNGSPLALKAAKAVEADVRAEIQEKVTPKFLPSALNRLNQ
jgi:hypothetical protein